MMPEPTEPCPLCGGKPTMHTTHFADEPEGFVLSCMGPNHYCGVHKIGGPEKTIAEWDKRMKARRA